MKQPINIPERKKDFATILYKYQQDLIGFAGHYRQGIVIDVNVNVREAPLKVSVTSIWALPK